MKVERMDKEDKEEALARPDMVEAIGFLLEGAGVGLYVSDFYTGEVLLINRKLAAYLGVTNAAALIGQPCWMFLNPEGKWRCSFCPNKLLLDEGENPTEPHVWERYLEHSGVWLKVISQAARLSDDRLVNINTFFDITEAKMIQAAYAGLEFRDLSLGLKNELALERDLWAKAKKPSLILIELLTLHLSGGAQAHELKELLRQSVRDWILGQELADAELYSIGGEKFCLALHNISQKETKELADSLMRGFPHTHILEHSQNRQRICCSAAVAVVPSSYIHEGQPITDISERLLAKAKKSSIAKATVYDERMEQAYQKSLRLAASLQKSMHEGMSGFQVYYQPIIDGGGSGWCGLEALCRWHSPELGTVTPRRFIAEAERLDLAGQLSLWVLKKALCACRLWGLDQCPDFMLNVNMSPAQFWEESLAAEILRLLKEYGFPPQKLCIEIGSNASAAFLEHSAAAINQLREHRIAVALDDFGTAYANYPLLQKLPLDVVKSGRKLVADIDKDTYRQYLFRAISELTHNAKMKLIADGVESVKQRDVLLAGGADCLQGYLFGRPMPAEVIEKKLACFAH